MSRDAVQQKLAEILSQFVKDPKALQGLNDGSRIVEDLGINSARFIDIVLVVEDEYGIELSDDTLDEMRTFGDAVTAIVQEQEKAAG